MKSLYLNYKDENGEVRYQLKDGAKYMENAKGFSAEEFYSTLDKVIRELSPRGSFEPIMIYPRNNNPITLFGFLFYFLKGMSCNAGLEKELDYLKQFIDYKIDLLMIVNFLSEVK